MTGLEYAARRAYAAWCRRHPLEHHPPWDHLSRQKQRAWTEVAYAVREADSDLS